MKNSHANNKLDGSYRSLLYPFIVVFLPFAFGFILNCLFRTMNAVLVPSIEKSISIPPSELGLLISVYFLAYGAFQIPLGTILDRYGAKRVQAVLYIIASIGLIIFASSNSVVGLTIAHFLIGVGMAGGLMSALKIIVQWFPTDKIAVVNGLMMTFGGAGIVLAAAPTEFLAVHLGWREVMVLYAVITICISFAIYYIVPDKNTAVEIAPFKQQMQGLAFVYKNRFFWRLAPLVSTVLGSFMAIQALWIEGWLRYVDHYTQVMTDKQLFAIGISMTLALLLTGPIAKYCQKKSIPLTYVLGISSFAFIICQFCIVSKVPAPPFLLWASYGFLSHILNLCYAIFATYFPKTHSGRANAALNVMTFIFAFALQYTMGVIIQYWAHTTHHTVDMAYQIAFSLAICMQILAFLWFVLSPYLKGSEGAVTTI